MQKGQRVSLISKFAGLGDLLFSGFYFSFQSPLTSTSQSQHSKAGLMTHAELFVRQQKGLPGVPTHDGDFKTLFNHQVVAQC